MWGQITQAVLTETCWVADCERVDGGRGTGPPRQDLSTAQNMTALGATLTLVVA